VSPKDQKHSRTGNRAPSYEVPPLPAAPRSGPDPEQQAALEAERRFAGRRIYIGVAGWSYEDWVETVYPRGLPPYRRLEYIAQYFDCVEINSSFYAVPRRSQTAKWALAVPDGFLFTCKVPRTLTHEPGDVEGQAASFKDAIQPLVEQGKLGALLAQFPWYFRFAPETLDHLKRLADLFEGLPLVFEIRHRSFLRDPFFELLKSRSIGLANIDMPVSKTSPPPAASTFGPCGYFRLHGRNREAWFDPEADRDQKYNYLYSLEELQPWVERIRRAAAEAPRVFVIANNHYRGQAPANALDIAYLLGEIRSAPEPLVRTYPHLAERKGLKGARQEGQEDGKS